MAKTLSSMQGAPGSIPGQGTRSLMPQVGPHATTKEVQCAVKKTQHSENKKKANKKKKATTATKNQTKTWHTITLRGKEERARGGQGAEISCSG